MSGLNVFLFLAVELKQYFAKFGPVRSASIIFVSMHILYILCSINSHILITVLTKDHIHYSRESKFM